MKNLQFWSYVVVLGCFAFNASGQEFDLTTLDGNNGFVINGANDDDFSGNSVSHAGDINADGIDDFIIGAQYANPLGGSNYGASYVIFGTASGFSSSLELSDLNGINGFRVLGVNEDDQSGISVSYAGDVNGDGIDDILIGARNFDVGESVNVGASYVVYGRNAGFPSSISLSSLNGSNGFAIHGQVEFSESGSSVSHAGDVNGDGMADIIIGASRAEVDGNSRTGISYVVFGDDSGFSSPLELSSLNGSNGFIINGAGQGDRSGFSVSIAGDVNGDGVDDLILGAPEASSDGNSDAGASYVVFGNASGFSAELELSSINGTNGFIINGVDTSNVLGSSVSAAGDVNGDGIDDVIIGGPRAENGNGSSYVVFGSSSGFSSPFYPTALNGSNGFTINSVDTFSELGHSVSGAGDFNGDGVSDVIIGTNNLGFTGSQGAVYVIFGSLTGFISTLDLLSLDGTDGFVIKEIESEGFVASSISHAGDVNADGLDDIIIGAPRGNFPRGVSYVVFGSDVIFAAGFENN